MKKLMLFLFLAFLAVSAWATTMVCNVDRLSLQWTGKTKIDTGIMLFQHKCIQNHYFWLTQEQMNQ